MAMDELHERVAAVALGAAAEHGFALGGGNALIAHGLITRPTQDVDLFTNQERGVEAAAGAVDAALRDAGFQVERADKSAGLSDIFYGMGEGLAEWVVTEPGGRQMALQMAYFDRANGPVLMEFGPVLDLEDAVGGKVCALAGRSAERDYLDTAAALERYTREQLIGFARRLDAGLEGEDFADAARRLDRTPDEAFTDLRLNTADVAALRERFASWPREAEPRRDPGPGREWDEPGPAGLDERGEPAPAPPPERGVPAREPGADARDGVAGKRELELDDPEPEAGL